MRGMIALCLLAMPATALAGGQFDWSADVRLVASDGLESWLDEGLGKLRFDESHDGVQVGRLRAAWSQPIGDVLNLHVDASLWRASDSTPLDLTEAFIEYRPVPDDAWRTRVRVGAFYAPISLEHRAAGWTNPYLISSSAINRLRAHNWRSTSKTSLNLRQFPYASSYSRSGDAMSERMRAAGWAAK